MRAVCVVYELPPDVRKQKPPAPRHGPVTNKPPLAVHNLKLLTYFQIMYRQFVGLRGGFISHMLAAVRGGIRIE